MTSAVLSIFARSASAAALLLTVAGCAGDSPRTSPPTSPSGPRSPSTAPTQNTPSRSTNAVKLQLTIDGRAVDAMLNDSAAARDFAALLPLTLGLSDFHQTERIADLPRRLSTSGAPAAAKPKAGDLAYYAPWGNLAIFYRDGDSSAPGLVILGHVAADNEMLATANKLTIAAAS